QLIIHRADPTSVERQIQRTRAVKAARDNLKAQKALDELCRIAETKENLMPCFIQAVKAYASVGEITEALKKVFGEFKEPVNI
ncbi:MAG TPA: methylmalonyl-CoA mutase family protein, partial [Thermodesulfobacteriota bacterium]|nr:methylmalonyl-CoA mutase family protein [Thermodesulfobacteriota bacterium]